MDYNLPGSLVYGILQARILEWVAISFSRGSSQPRDRTWVSHMAGRFFIFWATGEPRREQNIPPPLPLTGKSRWHCFLSQECFPKVMFSSLFVTAFQRSSLDSRDRWGGVDGDRVLTWPEGLGCGLGTWHTTFTSIPHCEPGPSSQLSFQISVVPESRKFCARIIWPLEVGKEEPGSAPLTHVGCPCPV